MKQKLRFNVLSIIGIFFILLGLTAIFYNFYLASVDKIFWICYIGMLIIGIGILIKEPLLISSQINLLLIPQALWTFDFLQNILFNQSSFSITSYYFTELSNFWQVISLYHILAMPLALFALYKIKLPKKEKNISLIISLVQISIIFFLTFLLTNQNANVNWIKESIFTNLLFFLNVPYFIKWFLIIIPVIILSHFIITYLFKKQFIKN